MDRSKWTPLRSQCKHPVSVGPMDRLPFGPWREFGTGQCIHGQDGQFLRSSSTTCLWRDCRGLVLACGGRCTHGEDGQLLRSSSTVWAGVVSVTGRRLDSVLECVLVVTGMRSSSCALSEALELALCGRFAPIDALCSCHVFLPCVDWWIPDGTEWGVCDQIDC